MELKYRRIIRKPYQDVNGDYDALSYLTVAGV